MKGDSFIYNFLVILSYNFEKVVKILTGRKFDISFLLEVPLPRVEIMTILASSGKMPFDKLLFIAFGKGWHKTLAAIFTSLGGITSKPTVFFMSSALKSSNISSGFVLQALLEDVIEGIFRNSLNTIDARMIWIWLNIKSIACVVSETLL